MQEISFTIQGDTIQLIQLLKAAGIVDSGGEAKQLVDSEQVKVNGGIELRKRAQLVPGDKVEVGSRIIYVV